MINGITHNTEIEMNFVTDEISEMRTKILEGEKVKKENDNTSIEKKNSKGGNNIHTEEISQEQGIKGKESKENKTKIISDSHDNGFHDFNGKGKCNGNVRSSNIESYHDKDSEKGAAEEIGMRNEMGIRIGRGGGEEGIGDEEVMTGTNAVKVTGTDIDVDQTGLGSGGGDDGGYGHDQVTL